MFSKERRRNPRLGLDETVRDPGRAEQVGMELANELREEIARERETVRRLRVVVDQTR